MDRSRYFVVRVSPEERRIIDRLAKVERLPSSTMARRLLLLAAESRGIYPSTEKSNRAQSLTAAGAVAD